MEEKIYYKEIGYSFRTFKRKEGYIVCGGSDKYEIVIDALSTLLHIYSQEKNYSSLTSGFELSSIRCIENIEQISLIHPGFAKLILKNADIIIMANATRGKILSIREKDFFDYILPCMIRI